MCGICGLISAEYEVNQSIVHCMNDALAHRGPDDTGAYDVPHINMAMCRLSFIDLAGGRQPIYHEENSIAVIANGEIYIYVELCLELEKKEHRFSSRSNVRTIVHLYEEYGLHCVEYLRGMFAMTLWDEKRQRMLLARERMGEKPFYLCEMENAPYFASDIKALLRSGKIEFEIDPSSVHLYFHYGYVPEPRMSLKSVCKLPPGYFLLVETKSWHIEKYTYWRLEDIPPLEGNPVELIRQQLEELSTLVGVDSNAIAAPTVRTYPGILQAFSVGYPGRHINDERQQTKSFAQSLKIPFHEVEITTAPVHEWHNLIFQQYAKKLVNGSLVQSGILKPEAGVELSTGIYPAGVVPIFFKALVLGLWARRMNVN